MISNDNIVVIIVIYNVYLIAYDLYKYYNIYNSIERVKLLFFIYTFLFKKKKNELLKIIDDILMQFPLIYRLFSLKFSIVDYSFKYYEWMR